MPKRKLKIKKKTSFILMNSDLKIGALALLIVIFCILTGMFFSATKITTQMFLTINFIPLMQAMMSLNFVYFILSGAITIALLLVCGKELIKPLNFIVPGGAFLVGAIIALLLFNLAEYLFVIIISLIGVPLSVSYLSKREEEVKYMKKFRSGASGAGRFLIIFGIAFILYLAMVSYSTRDTLEKNVATDILEVSIGNQDTLAKQIQDQFVGMLVSGQQATVQGIKSTPAYLTLEKKTDVDSLSFVATMEAIETQFKTDAYKKQLNDQISLNPQTNLGETIIEQIPAIGFFKKYAWLLYIMTSFFLVTFISEVLVKNFAGLFYYILYSIEGFTPTKQKTEQNPNN